MQDPYEVALFRHEQIAPLIDPSATPQQRREYVRERARQPVDWPQSTREKAKGEPPRKRPVGRATLYRWVEAQRRAGLPGLLPAPRLDRGHTKTERL